MPIHGQAVPMSAAAPEFFDSPKPADSRQGLLRLAARKAVDGEKDQRADQRTQQGGRAVLHTAICLVDRVVGDDRADDADARASERRAWFPTWSDKADDQAGKAANCEGQYDVHDVLLLLVPVPVRHPVAEKSGRAR